MFKVYDKWLERCDLSVIAVEDAPAQKRRMQDAVMQQLI